MINNNEFRKHAHEIVDWMADYLENVENYDVKSKVKPRDIYNKLPDNAPNESESIDEIMKDFKDIILPGVTHWQSPKFLAYFNGNSSYPSLLAEMLTATMGLQCMIWDTSPAAAELEEKVMNWLKEMIGIPKSFDGVIQDSASSSTLAAILSAREKYSEFKINETGFSGDENFKIYCSSETHSSIDKAVKIAGIGKENLTKIEVDNNLSMKSQFLEDAIKYDLSKNNKPICVIATIGTTSTTAVDSIEEISKICAKYNIWLHIDAAYAGTALILPEFQHLIKGIELADSFVFNPHKWMFTNFDCSAYFVKDKEQLIRTFEILPEYLKTNNQNEVNNYRDWGVQLGRRFRALKLWFVIRNFGLNGLQEKVRFHIKLAQKFSQLVDFSDNFERITQTTFTLVCFRYNPGNLLEEDLNTVNKQLMDLLNDSGKLYLTHTKVGGKFTLRIVLGQTNLEEKHINEVWKLINEAVELIKP